MSMTRQLPALGVYSKYLVPSYQNYPVGRYVSLLLVRKTESETIFRTEGSGEGLSKENVRAGLNDSEIIRRVVISKRKQVAVERRTGRELLREHGLLKTVKPKKGPETPCALNTNAPCGKCIDCLLYGFAVGGGGAQKSRIMTDDAYSLEAVSQVTGKRTFNAIYETGTMRDAIDETGAMRKEALTSHAINEDEYVLPETHFLDIETLKDVTLGELQYVLGNILRSQRYGAISSRQGRIRNSLVALIFSDTEIFSNLELTQAVYDLLPKEPNGNPVFPLADTTVTDAVAAATTHLLERVVGREPVVVMGEPLRLILEQTIGLYRDPDAVKALLTEIDQAYPHNQVKEEK